MILLKRYRPNLINAQTEIGEKSLAGVQGRKDLINFLVDGTLPMGNNKVEDLTLEQLDYNLKVFYTGIQFIYGGGIAYQKELDKTLGNLISAYKKVGGKADYDQIYEFKRPEKK